MDYIIIMDVSGDIIVTDDMKDKLGFIPMEYSLGDEMRVCNGPEDSATLKLFYDGQRNGDLTKTSQISPFMYETYLTPYFEKGLSVLYLCLSGGLSSTFQSANVAKAVFEENYPDLKFMPLDTLAATGGMGVLAERALRNMDHGMTIEENYEDLMVARTKIRHWFMVDDLMYLKRGGRVSGATALIGTALNIKPILTIDEKGALETTDKKRGAKIACKHLVETFAKEFDPETGDVVYILDADDSAKSDMIEAGAKKAYPDAKFRRCVVTPIIGAHVGPGMAAIVYIGK